MCSWFSRLQKLARVTWPFRTGEQPALGLGLAHINAGERVSEANQLAAKPVVGGGSGSRFGGGPELASGRYLGFANSRL